MSARRGPWSFRSFRTRLLVFLLALLIPVLLGIYFFVNRGNQDYTTETINSYLELGADVFDFSREQHKQTLLTITSTLTRDWGFRNAFGTGDPATIFDAAQNLLGRSLGGADMMLIAELDGEVIIDTATQGFERLDGEWLALMQAAETNRENIGDAIITVHGVPYQMTVLPLYLPRPVAWIFGGFPLDNEFAASVKQSIVSDVSIIKIEAGQSAAQDAPQRTVIASTLSAADQLRLLEQIRFAGSVPAPVDGLFDVASAAVADVDLGDLPAGTQRISLSGGDYGTLVRPLYGAPGDPLQINAVIQKSYRENEENLLAFQSRLLQFYLLVLGVSLVAAVLLARSVTEPILNLARRVQHIEQGDYHQAIDAGTGGRDEIAQLASSVNNMARGLAEKERVRTLLGKVVSPAIAEALLDRKIELGGEEKVITILFADIKGFTSMCETRQPAHVLRLLNSYLSEITRAIDENHGVVDKFSGDSVMALFGAPISHEGDADNAIRSALAVQKAMSALNAEYANRGIRGIEANIEAGIGVHTGLVVAGNLGSVNRMNYTVIGDAVNLAARLEGLTRFYHVQNVVSEATRNAAPGYIYREIDIVRVKGKQEPVRIYELMGRPEDVSEAQLVELEEFEAGVSAYRQQLWEIATHIFKMLESRYAHGNSIYQLYLSRIERYKVDPPGRDWDAVFTFRRK